MARILVVDDERFILRALNAILAASGHDVVTIDRGDRAIDLIGSEEFDMVISDIKMTPVDGMAVLRAAKQMRPAMPVVIMTAYTSADTEEQATESGAFDYLKKPFKMQRLLETVERAVPA